MHIVRHPADTWLAHFTPEERKNRDVIMGVSKNVDYGVKFYLYDVYATLRRNVKGVPDAENALDVFLINFAYCNWLASKQLALFDNGVIISLEMLAEEFLSTITKIRTEAGIYIDPALRVLVDKRRVYFADSAFRREVEERLNTLVSDKMLKRWWLW